MLSAKLDRICPCMLVWRNILENPLLLKVVIPCNDNIRTIGAFSGYFSNKFINSL